MVKPYKAFIDGDMPVYEACQDAEDAEKDFDYCKSKFNSIIEGQFIEAQKWFNKPTRPLNSDLHGYTLYIGSDDYSNYRYKVSPDYKISRKGKPKPKYFWELKNWILETFDVHYVQGREADDLVSIHALEYGENAIIVGGDKDYRMVEGCWHFEPNKGIPPYFVEAPGCLLKLRMLTGNWREFGTGRLWFWYQMIVGDEADDIKGIPKKGHAFAWKFLLSQDNLLEIPERVKELYKKNKLSEEQFDINARLLWIQRTLNDNEIGEPWCGEVKKD